MPTPNRHFDLIAVIDWSAASKPGPKKPSPDRCWIGWSDGRIAPKAEYFRTRYDCIQRLKELCEEDYKNILFAFDFPFGYPAGSGLSGGRTAGARLVGLFQTDHHDGNNRFDVASKLNNALGNPQGPFWGHPAKARHQHLTPTKPDLSKFPFTEWRLAEKRLKDQGYRIMNVWQLLGQASVGSQTLTGLNELYGFASTPPNNKPVRYWPFETNWDGMLEGIILGEVWPSLQDADSIDHPIKDARQVLACCQWLMAHNNAGTIKPLFACPKDLSLKDAKSAASEEGWILGLESLGL